MSKQIINDVLKLAKEYESGENSQQLADKYNTSRKVICDALKRAGCDRRNNSESQKGKISTQRIITDLPKLVEEYKSGLSTVKLADNYNTSTTVIRDWLERGGCPRRSLSEAHADFSGSNHPRYKGRGRYVNGIYLTPDANGYLRRICKDHPLADKDGRIGEHVYQACLKWGVDKVRGKEVHHKDDNKQNNNWNNLQLLTKSKHRFIENNFQKN